MAVGQRQVEQHDVEGLGAQPVRASRSDRQGRCRTGPPPPSELTDKPGIAWIILDQEDVDGPLVGHAVSRIIQAGGSRTAVSQKSFSRVIILMKSSCSTGFVRKQFACRYKPAGHRAGRPTWS